MFQGSIQLEGNGRVCYNVTFPGVRGPQKGAGLQEIKAWLSQKAGADPGIAPLVLLPPVGGDRQHWGIFRALVAERVRTVAIDPRGFGSSSPSPLAAGPRSLSGDVLKAMDALELEAVTLFGLSFGSAIAARLAIEQPHRIQRVILASMPVATANLPLLRAAELWRLVSCLFARKAKSCLQEELSITTSVMQSSSQGSAAAIKERLDDLERRKPHSRLRLLLLALAAALGAPRGELARIENKAVFLFGADDPLLSPTTLDCLRTSLPLAEIVSVPGAGHHLTLDAPASMAELVLRFLTAFRNSDLPILSDSAR